MRIAALAFTQVGYDVGRRLAASLGEASPEGLTGDEDGTTRRRTDDTMTLDRCPAGGLAAWTSAHVASCDALVFIGSAGIAVRAIAPFVVSKTSDPAVVVIDEQGRFVVPILSGHIGQANTLARRLAKAGGATAVLTTATDARGLFAVDDWATLQGLRVVNPGQIKAVSSKLLAGATLRLASDFPIAGAPPSGVVCVVGDADVVVSCRRRDPRDQALHLVPVAVTAGIGCRRGVEAQTVETAFMAALAAAGYHPASVRRVCSIDLKAAEAGLLDFCARRGLAFRTFSADELQAVGEGFTASAFVTTVTGVDNVCERAAVAGSEGGRLVAPKRAQGGVTVALALCEPVLSFDAPQDLSLCPDKLVKES